MKIILTETQHKKMILNQFGKVLDEPKEWFGKLYEWTNDPVLKGGKKQIQAYDKDGKYLGYYDKESDFGYIVSESWSPELMQDLEAFHGEGEHGEDEHAVEELDEEKGLWDNIRAKRARGEKPAKPGDEDYPDKKQWDKLTKKSKKK